MESLKLPTNIEFQEGREEDTGEVVISPFEKGYGHTIANAYRRVLLSSLPGGAVESIKIEGVQHEFSTVDGVLEDVIEIILNIKELAVKVHSENSVTLSMSVEGEGEVTAEEFEDNADVDIVNPGTKLFEIADDDAEVEMEITVGQGRGYVQSEEKDTEDWVVGKIAVDSHYSPIRNVGYDIEKTRVGDITDYDKATINVETNGTINAQEAIERASEILIDHFSLINDAAKEGEVTTQEEAEEKELEETEEPSMDWLKDELIEYAEAAGIEVQSGDTKQDILDKIEAKK